MSLHDHDHQHVQTTAVARVAGEDRHAPPALEREIEAIRGRMTAIARELHRRKSEALDWRLQVRRHAGLLALVGAGVVLLAGGAIAWRRHRRGRRVDLDAGARRPGPVEAAAAGLAQRLASAAVKGLASGFGGALFESVRDRSRGA